MPDRRDRQAFACQLAELLLVQLANWRWGWRSMVVLGMAAPLLSITML
ncbi:MAG: ABC transporter permease, partial [Chloroflexi bacterium]|nr:ABC transporter permease [Chloroflexota bacterium]